jgi:hypothetical protein
MIDNTQKSENDINIGSLIDKVDQQVGLNDRMKEFLKKLLKKQAI